MRFPAGLVAPCRFHGLQVQSATDLLRCSSTEVVIEASILDPATLAFDGERHLHSSFQNIAMILRLERVV